MFYDCILRFKSCTIGNSLVTTTLQYDCTVINYLNCGALRRLATGFTYYDNEISQNEIVKGGVFW